MNTFTTSPFLDGLKDHKIVAERTFDIDGIRTKEYIVEWPSKEDGSIDCFKVLWFPDEEWLKNRHTELRQNGKYLPKTVRTADGTDTPIPVTHSDYYLNRRRTNVAEVTEVHRDVCRRRIKELYVPYFLSSITLDEADEPLLV